MMDLRQQKKTLFHQQIRRRHIEDKFKLLRHEVPHDITLNEAEKLVNANMKQLSQYIDLTSDAKLLGQSRFNVMLKELNDISCMHITPAIFSHPANLSIFLTLQNNPSLQRISQKYVHQILLNVSADQFLNSVQFQTFNITTLRIAEILKQNRVQVIQLLLQLCGNFLLRDNSNRTFYHLVNRVGIFRLLIGFLLDRRNIYEAILPSFLWFTNKILSDSHHYRYWNQQDGDSIYKSFIILIFGQIRKFIQFSVIEVKENSYPENKNQLQYNLQLSQKMDKKYGKSDSNGLSTKIHKILIEQIITCNELLRYLKTLLKIPSIFEEIPEELVDLLSYDKIFDTDNTYYLEVMCTITFRTNFCFSSHQISALMDRLLEDATDILSPTVLRLLNNCLANDGTHWNVIITAFLEYGGWHSQYRKSRQKLDETGLMSSEQLNKSTCYIIYFLKNVKTQHQMCEILHGIICGQGGLGVLQQCVDYIYDCNRGAQIMEQLGFTVENDE